MRTNKTNVHAEAPPRSVQVIKAQLPDLAKVKKMAVAYCERDFASSAGMQSLLIHERELLEELHAAAEILERDRAGEASSPIAQASADAAANDSSAP